MYLYIMCILYFIPKDYIYKTRMSIYTYAYNLILLLDI